MGGKGGEGSARYWSVKWERLLVSSCARGISVMLPLARTATEGCVSVGLLLKQTVFVALVSGGVTVGKA